MNYSKAALFSCFFYSLSVSGAFGRKAACYLEAMEFSVQKPKIPWQGLVCTILNRTLGRIPLHPLVSRLQPVHIKENNYNNHYSLQSFPWNSVCKWEDIKMAWCQTNKGTVVYLEKIKSLWFDCRTVQLSAFPCENRQWKWDRAEAMCQGADSLSGSSRPVIRTRPLPPVVWQVLSAGKQSPFFHRCELKQKIPSKKRVFPPLPSLQSTAGRARLFQGQARAGTFTGGQAKSSLRSTVSFLTTVLNLPLFMECNYGRPDS